MPHIMKRNTVLSYWLRPATYPLPYQTLLMSVFIYCYSLIIKVKVLL